jgi:uncharacterized membrane protein
MEFVFSLLANVAEMVGHIVIGWVEMLLGLIASEGQRRATYDETHDERQWEVASARKVRIPLPANRAMQERRWAPAHRTQIGPDNSPDKSDMER